MRLKLNIILDGQVWPVGTEIPDELVPPHIALKYAAIRENEEVVSVSAVANGEPAQERAKSPKKTRVPPSDSPGVFYLRRGFGFKRMGQCEPMLHERKYRHIVGKGYQPAGVVEAEEMG